MKPDKSKNELEAAVRSLIQTAMKDRGNDGLRELEDLFTVLLKEVRNREASYYTSGDLDDGPVHRERYRDIVGESTAILRIFRLLDRVADSVVPVLIQGESGTGKELIATAIHRNSSRRDQAFVAENCAAIPETLLESELFGYKRGAFTGADKNKVGLFKVADGSSLFLDEIGDMSLTMQKKLLRVLQDGEIRPVGSNEVFHVDVRIISASNKNLKEMVKRSDFREDLYYRLNTITVTIPPLRDRDEDIPLLVDFFVKRVADEMKVDVVPIDATAMKALQRYKWPGNIRELENEIRRCLALLGDETIIELASLSENIQACA